MKRYKLDYTWDEDFTELARMAESPDGEWVRAEDAIKLQRRLDRLQDIYDGWITEGRPK